MGKDFLRDTETGDLMIVDGDFVIGESDDQEVSVLITLNQGELKNDPLLGPNLVQLTEGKEDKNEINKRLRIHLQRDGKDWNDYKDRITH
jgi:hypothetical protein